MADGILNNKITGRKVAPFDSRPKLEPPWKTLMFEEIYNLPPAFKIL